MSSQNAVYNLRFCFCFLKWHEVLSYFIYFFYISFGYSLFLFFQLLLAVGAKLEHVIAQLAHEVAEKHIAIEGDLVVQPSDDHFWFQRPRIVLFLIHFILFQNAFEIGFFFWIWVSKQQTDLYLLMIMMIFLFN